MAGRFRISTGSFSFCRICATAERRCDGWVLRGHKRFATAADGASIAVVMALTDPAVANPCARASMFMVPADTDGFELILNISVMGHAGCECAALVFRVGKNKAGCVDSRIAFG